MKHTEATFDGFGGIKLYYQYWKPEGEQRATIAIVHGFGEHSGRYMNVVDWLVPAGYAVYAFDLRGHGRSPGQRAYINSWSEYRGDVRAFLDMVASQEPHQPLFLYGHSLGGLIVLEYTLHFPDGLAGVISSAPTVGQVFIPSLLLMLSRIASRVYPRLSINAGLDVTGLSRDPVVVQAYRDDPLVNRNGTARLGTELAVAREYTNAHTGEFRLPLLMTFGSADRLAAPEACREFYNAAGSQDKTCLEYPGGYHESHNDIEWKRVMTDMEHWLNEHTNPKSLISNP